MTEHVSHGDDHTGFLGDNSYVWEQIRRSRSRKPRSRRQHVQSLLYRFDTSSDFSSEPVDKSEALENTTSVGSPHNTADESDPAHELSIEEDDIMEKVIFIGAVPNVVDQWLESNRSERVRTRHPHFSRIDRNALEIEASRDVRGFEELTLHDYRALLSRERNLDVFTAPLPQSSSYYH